MALLRFRLSGLIPLALLFVSCSAVGEDTGQNAQVGVSWQGGTRTYRYHVPDNVGKANDAPLVIAFHGAGDSGANFQKNTGLDDLADRFGFMVAYPNATGTNWAEGCNCIRPDLDGVDDVGFADQVIDSMQEQFAVDTERIFAIGFSQGAIFTHRLACDRAGVYAGFAAISGMMNTPVASRCNVDTPVDMFMMHGRKDNVLPYGGFSGAQATLSVPETFDLWRSMDGCADEFDSQTYSADGQTWNAYHATQCESGSRVRLVVAENGGHQWFGGSSGSANSAIAFLILGE